MKKISFLFLAVILALAMTYTSCKDDVEDAIDCSIESVFLTLDADVDDDNPRMVHFTFINGDTIENKFTLDPSIKYEFGDGNEESLQTLETTHSYTDAGTYTVKAYYTLRRGSSSCDSYKEKTVTVE